MKVFSKIEVQWIFCPKFLDFYFCRKLCFDKFERPDFKYGNRFSKLQPKNTLARPFWSRTWKLFHCTKLYLLKYLSVQASNKTVLFSNSRLKNLNKTLIFPWFFLVSSVTLDLDKFEGVDFNYDKSYSKLQLKDTQIGHFWFKI